MVVTAEDGSVLFTGYLATEPVQIYVGLATTGAAYKMRLEAVSDEWLLDRLGPGLSAAGLAQDAGELLQQLTTRGAGGRAVCSRWRRQDHCGRRERSPRAIRRPGA